MTLSRAVFVDRQNRDSAVATFRKISEEMKRVGVRPPRPFSSEALPALTCPNGQLNLFIFAEGTRSGSSVPALLPFKKGAFHLAIEAQIPLIPVVCENYHSLYHSSTKTHPSPIFERGRLVIKVLEPIPTTDYKDGANGGSNALADKARERMLAALIELSKRPGAASGGRQTAEEEEKVRKLVAEGKKGI